MKKFVRSFLCLVAMLFGMGFLVACGSPAITAIEISGVPQYMEAGQEVTLTAVLTPKNASQGDVLWSSSDKNVATVSSSGKVTALATGTTQITAMSKKNSNVKATVSLRVFGQDATVILLDKTYVYDGTAKSNHAISRPAGIELRYTYSSETYEESEYEPINAGTYTVKAYNSLTGAVLAQASMTINPKQATLSIRSYTKHYSENDPAFAADVDGMIGSDRITYTLSRTRGETVGKYAITADITDSTNYRVVVSQGTLEIKPLDVKIEVDNKTSVYGNSLSALTFTLKTKDNAILGEAIKTQVTGNLKLITSTSQGRLPVGNYTISCEDLKSTNLSIISANNGVYTVTKRTAIVSVSAGQYKYSGEKDPDIIYSIDGTQEGDDLSGCLSRVAGETVGFYNYELNQTINANYNLRFNESMTNFSFEIKSNEITVAFNNFEIDYSTENAEGAIPTGYYNYTITKNGKPLEYTLDASGKIYLNSTDAVILNHNVTKELTLSDTEKQSYYQKWKVALEKSAVAGFDDPIKYVFTFVDGYKFIKLIPLTITGNYATKVYGETDPTFDYTVSGYLEGDKDDNVIKTIELKRESGENVATYNITLKSDVVLFDTKSYYKVVYENGTFEITKRELRVTPVNYTGDNSVYYGESPKELKINEKDLNLAPRDILSKVLGGSLTRANNENVGSYAILGTNLELLSNNYTLTFTQGTYTIIPRPVAVTAINKTIEYGETVSKYQYSYQVLDEFTLLDADGESYTVYKEYVLGNPTFTGSLSLTTYGILYAGNTYTIGQGNLTCGSNYTITFYQGTLTVVPREITVTFNAQSYGFTDYNEQNPDPKFSISPSLAYSDKCKLTYYNATSSADSNIISLQKDADNNYQATFEMTTSDGRIINDCYNIHIDENYTELFYLGTSLIDVAITNVDGELTVNKTYGDNYALKDVLTLTTTKAGYTLEYTENVFNIKGLTNADTFVTPASVDIDAGTYTVAIFTKNLKIKNQDGTDVSSNFAINITSYASLVVEKATLTATTEPTINRIVYGTEKPTFNGGTYTFTKANGDTVTITGTNSEYSTADTSSYSVTTAENPHLIMATFNPSNTNFKSYTHSNLKLAVTRAIVDTTVLTWDYGVSMEKDGEFDGGTYTVRADIEGASHITYNQETTSQNTYNISTKLPNYRFLKQTLSFEYLYYGVMFKEDVDGDDNVTDGGYMYYIDGGVIKKVYPANKTSFYAKYNSETDTLEIYYNDGGKDYLLTNSSTLAEDGKPTYNTSIYSPTTSGIYFVRARISSLNNNYAVAGDGLGENNNQKIDYHNLFMVNKVTVRVYSFTNEIIYDNPLTFVYVTDPQNITGKVTKYFSKDAEGNYTELTEAPKNVGLYACTFVIDRANYYYFKEYSEFNIIPVTIRVEWGNEESFNYAGPTTPITRQFKVYANDDLVYQTGSSMQIPEWLSIVYSGLMKNGQTYPTDGGSTIEVPFNAGDYTIKISAVTDSSDHNYVGESTNNYSINQIFYSGNISIRAASITYDVEYSKGQEGAKAFYNLIVEKMINNWTPDNEEFNVVLTYQGVLLDPTGTDTRFVDLLNRAGGPYKITMAISSKDGNYKETIRTASLNVNKTNIPNMASYSTEAISIPYNGDNIYNELTTADGSMSFTPTHIDTANKTYEYWHNDDKETYFSITYTYYLVTSSTETYGILTTVPNAPDETLAYIYMVKAVITNGANYNEPIQNTYYGYFYVVKTTIDMRAENVSVEYTGEDIELPTVKAVNGSNIEVAIRYDNKAGSTGVLVTRTVTKNGSTVSKINGIGEYLVKFVIASADRTYFYDNGSTFETSCTVTVTPKKIIADPSFIVKPEIFYTQLFAQNSNTFKLDSTKAKAFNPDYINNNTLQIELYITDKNDGTGNIYQRKAWKNLPAGTYYYYVGLIANPTGSKIKNYVQSDYVEFEIARQLYTIELTEEAQDGVTINYAPSTSQIYSYTNLIVKKNGVSQSGFTQDDFEVLYKLSTEEEDAYSTTAPITNGTYDVKIRLFNGFYESDYLYTTLTISAPTLNISGNISFVYGQADTTLSISLSATGTNYSDSLTSSFAENGKFTYSTDTDSGRWFILAPDMLCTPGDPYPRQAIEVEMEDGSIVDLQPLLFSYLEQNEITVKFLSDLNAMGAGANYLPIFYFSKNKNFALSYSEFIVTVTQYTITADMISLKNVSTDDGKVSTPSGSFDTETNTYNIKITKSQAANSAYNDGWGFENLTIANKKTYFELGITFPTGKNSPVGVLNATSTISTIIESATIENYFADPTNNKIIITASLNMDDSNYTVGNDVVFTIEYTLTKTTTTVFSEKTNGDGSYQEIEFAYNKYFLDEYWARLNEKNRTSRSIPDVIPHGYKVNEIDGKYSVERTHIYIYDLINTPYTFKNPDTPFNLPNPSKDDVNTDDNYYNIELFLSAWTKSSEAYNDIYSLNAYKAVEQADGTYTKGDKQSKGEVFNKDDSYDHSGIYSFYKYDITKDTSAGLYLVEVVLKESNYFAETKFNALIRIKPTTYYLRTSNDGFNKVIRKGDEEQIALYPDQNSNTPADVSFTANYYRVSDNKLVYTSHVSGTTHTAVKGSFSDLYTGENTSTQQFRIEIVPDDENSVYAEEIYTLVIVDNIDLGVFNIYDVFDLDTLQKTNSQLATVAEIGTLSWAAMLEEIFEKTGNSLTEDALSIMRFLDASSDVKQWTPDTSQAGYSGYFQFDMLPNSNHQFVYTSLTLRIDLADGSASTIMVSLKVNAKLITKSNETTYVYDGNAHAPEITAHFQGWTYRVYGDESQVPQIDKVLIKELTDDSTKYVPSEAPTVKYYRTNNAGDIGSSEKPTDAGSYKVVSTYKIKFAGMDETYTFECTNNFTILKAKADITMNETVVLYDGRIHNVSATSLEGLDVDIKYYDDQGVEVFEPKNAGVYRVVANIRDSYNYYGTAETTLTIKMTSTRIELILPDNLVYTGNNIKPTFKIYNENNVEISLPNGSYKEYFNGGENVSSKAGSYIYKLEIIGNINTLPNSATISYVIEKATPTISFEAPANNVYSGQKITPKIVISPAQLANDSCYIITYNGSTEIPTAAGVYIVNVSYSPDSSSNYNAIEKSYPYEIIPQSIRVTYDGNSSDKIITITYSPDMSAATLRASAQTDANVIYTYEGYTYNDDGSLSTTKYSSKTFPVDAGIYTITATPESSNYTGILVTTLVINRATPSITFNGVMFTYNGEAQTPTASTSPNTLTYETKYTGVDYAGVAYDSTTTPTNAGIYTMTTSFAGNKNYMDVKGSQAFTISKIGTAKLEFVQDSLTTTYNGSELKPTVKVLINDVENTDLENDVILTFSETGHTPINAGSYKVVASLNTCNYTANEITATFVINKSGDYTITLDGEGKLTLSATRFGTTSITSETIEIEYVGKIYLSDGSLSEENNYTSFSFPAGIAGLYTGTIISDNYEAKTFDFEIEKTDLSSRISVTDISIVLGQKPELVGSLTIDGKAYNVTYTFKLQDGTDYTSTMPNAIGNHSMKVVINDRNYKGEKVVEYTVTYPNSNKDKVVLDSPYYMYTGSDIVIGAKLYLNGILQSNASKKYKKDGSYINSIVDEGEYEVELYIEGNSGTYVATVTVVPALTLSVPSGAIYDKTEKEVSYAFVASEKEAIHGSHVSLKLTKDGYYVNKAINAGSYIATLCYDDYPILTKTFTIQKQTIDSDTLGASLPNGGITVTYGSYNSIPTVLNTHTVKYLISVGGTTSYKEITPPVGDHKIKFVIDEDNYQGETITTLHVSKKLLVIDIDDFETDYTGKTLVLPETLANFDFLTYKYNTVPSNYIDGLPTNAGTYYISVNSSSQNYAVTFRDSSRPYIIVTIKKATPQYIITNLEQVYDGSVKVPSATAIYNGVAYATHVSNSNMINVGTYTITFSINGNSNFNDSAEYTFTIKKADVTISYTLPSNLVYDGTQKAITATASVEAVGAVSQTITKDGVVVTPIDAGTYLVTLSTEETENYNACTVNIVFAILPADITVECFISDTNYSGSPKNVEVTTDQSGASINVSYDGLEGVPTDAGDYVAIVTVTPNDKNYAVKTIRYKFSITKILDPINFTAPSDNCFDYDGTAKGISNVTSGSGTHTVTYEVYKNGSYTATTADKVVDEGSYKAVVKTLGDKNYLANTKTVCFNIKKRLIVASITSNIVTYNKAPQSVILEDNSGLGSKIVVKYYGYSYNAEGVCEVEYASKEEPTTQSPTNPGIYTALLMSTDDNYAIAGNATATLIINRLATSINIKIDGVLDDTIVVNYTGTKYTVSATTSNGDTLADDKIIITLSGYNTTTDLQEGGNYEIVADINNDLYFGYSKRLFTIRPQEATIFAKQTAIGYTGAENDLVYIVVDKNGNDITAKVKENISAEYFSNGTKMEGKPIVVGEYTAHLTLANSSYAADATYTFNIVKSTPYVEYKANVEENGTTVERTYTLNTVSYTSVPNFKTASNAYSLKVNGGTINSASYSAKFYGVVYDVDDQGELIETWVEVTDNTITTAGSYRITISVTDAAKVKEFLANMNIDDSNIKTNTSGEKYIEWEFLFSVSSQA